MTLIIFLISMYLTINICFIIFHKYEKYKKNEKTKIEVINRKNKLEFNGAKWYVEKILQEVWGFTKADIWKYADEDIRDIWLDNWE